MQKLCWKYIFISIFYMHITKLQGSRRKGDLEDAQWHGRWFPYNPDHKTTASTATSAEPVVSNDCDDGVHGINIDFMSTDYRYHYLCVTSNYTAFTPNLQTQPILTEYYIPPAYTTHSECLTQTLSYNEPLPTYGTFRPLAPKYGTYKYLPAQRWLRSLAEGAIVMLYHPCAEQSQRKLLEKLVNACLYRHIISANTNLSSEYPLALLSWGKRLQMSVVDKNIVIDFIKTNALHGPFTATGEEIHATKYYDALLETEAKLITDIKDKELCAFDAAVI